MFNSYSTKQIQNNTKIIALKVDNICLLIEDTIAAYVIEKWASTEVRLTEFFKYI